MANSYLDRTPSSTGNSKTFTISCWIKRSKLSYNFDMFYTAGLHTTTLMSQLYFTDTDQLFWGAWIANGNADHYIATTRKFRDTSGWYHLCVAVDTTQATASDRVKIYVNGIQETDIDSSQGYPAQNFDYAFNSTLVHNIGRRGDLASSYHEGYLSYVIMVDGTALAPTAFGETDATSGEWKIKTSPSVTYGTNGFFILKDNASGTDQSGEGNDFTANGNLTNMQDCPDDVFATFNPLDNYYNASTLSNGNTTVVTSASGYTCTKANIGITKGKFYWETKYVSKSGGNKYPTIGISSTQVTGTNQELGHYANDWGYLMDNTATVIRNNDGSTTWGSNYTEGDIICVALDADNSKLYFRKNDGSWENSGDPTSGSTGTGAVSVTAPASTPLGSYFPAIGYWDGSYSGTFQTNFGNGYFATSAISSEGTNASGIGKFEYDVPTGYTALSLKGLNS